ncbi:hypothetical protein [Sporosarcina sp. FSL K6-1508]|uniref:hypothetical protein n=1 Tax=Sporosarcina sp. FSL K6-1508 TaxID=2921553 RepID=UPI0030FACB82
MQNSTIGFTTITSPIWNPTLFFLARQLSRIQGQADVAASITYIIWVAAVD